LAYKTKSCSDILGSHQIAKDIIIITITKGCFYYEKTGKEILVGCTDIGLECRVLAGFLLVGTGNELDLVFVCVFFIL